MSFDAKPARDPVPVTSACLLIVLAAALHAVWILGPAPLSPEAAIWTMPSGDLAMTTLGAEALLQDSWHWPLAATGRLVSGGEPVSVAYTDSLPALTLLLKLLGLGPSSVAPIGLAILVSCLLQPLAAAYALREAGLRHPLALVPGALLLGLLPAWYFRFVAEHVALTWHWLVLVALGLAFRWCRSGRSSPAEAAGGLLLCAVAVGTHAYLAFQVLAVLGSGLLGLWVAGRRRAALSLGFGLLTIALGTAVLVGFLPPPAGGVSLGQWQPPPGFYGANLLAPFDFGFSSLLPSGRSIDATGGQYEGMAYLGLGAMLLLAVACGTLLLPAARPGASRPGRTWPLWLGVGLLAAFAVHPKLYFGERLLLTLPMPEALGPLLEQFRAGGRMLWPGLYLLLAVAIARVASALGPKRAAAVLALALALQLADTWRLREGFAALLPGGPSGEPPALVAMRKAGLFDGRAIRLRPGFLCMATDAERELARSVSLATLRASGIVHQPPMARGGSLDCDLERLAGSAALHGVTDLFLRRSTPMHVQAELLTLRNCQVLPAVLACDAQRSDGPPPAAQTLGALLPHLPAGQRLPVSAGAPATPWLVSGWSQPEPWGTWTAAGQAELVVPLPEEGGVTAILLEVTAYAPLPPFSQRVTFRLRDQIVWQGEVPRGETVTVRLPLDTASRADRLASIRIDIAEPRSPASVGQGADPRSLGLGLFSLRLARDIER